MWKAFAFCSRFTGYINTLKALRAPAVKKAKLLIFLIKCPQTYLTMEIEHPWKPREAQKFSFSCLNLPQIFLDP